MEFHRKHSVCFLLLGMLFCTAGCTATEQDSTAEKPKKMTDLPPLVTEISTEDTTAEISTETTLVTEEAELPEPVYQAKVTAWELPEELGSLQAVRVYPEHSLPAGCPAECGTAVGKCTLLCVRRCGKCRTSLYAAVPKQQCF